MKEMKEMKSESSPDFSKRKSPEKEKREKARKVPRMPWLKTFFDASLDLFCVAGTDGYFKELNPAWERCLGWTLEELLERPWLDFVHPDDVEATIKEAGAMKERGVVSFRNRYRHKDGDYRWLSWRATRWSEEGITHAVARDITELKQAEEALRQAHDELEIRIQERTAELEKVNRTLQAEIANREQAQEQIKSQLERLAALRTIDLAITSSLDLRVTFNVIIWL